MILFVVRPSVGIAAETSVSNARMRRAEQRTAIKSTGQLSTFAKSVAEKIVQLGNRVDLFDRLCEVVADSMKLDRIAIQCNV